jgi:predicted NBD/HSP70 family sugar kinase
MIFTFRPSKLKVTYLSSVGKGRHGVAGCKIMGLPAEGVESVLRLFRTRGPLTRADVARLTGMSRTALNQRLDVLLGAGLLVASQGGVRTKGRPADQFQFDGSGGVLLVADVGASGMRVALSDLDGRIRAESAVASDVTDGPEAVLGLVQEQFEALLSGQRCDTDLVRGIGVDVPGPVQNLVGQVISPPIMPGWDRFDIPAWFGHRFGCPVFVEKDANAIAYGEHRVSFPHARQLMAVKVGHGIGSGLVLDGSLYRGADGGAGDVGHMHYGGDQEGPQCKCGNVGCVEAFAGGWALLRDLREAGHPITSMSEALRLVERGEPDAIRLVRAAGRVIGAALAGPVNLINPRVLVVGGQLVTAGGTHLFAGIREMIYRRSLPLATSNIEIVQSTLHPRAGLLGLSLLVTDSIFSGGPLDVMLNGDGLVASSGLHAVSLGSD